MAEAITSDKCVLNPLVCVLKEEKKPFFLTNSADNFLREKKMHGLGKLQSRKKLKQLVGEALMLFNVLLL